MIIAEEGTPRADKGGWATSSENLYNLYKKYLHNAKECSTIPGCFEQIANSSYKWLNGTPDNAHWNESGYGKLILADGVQVVFIKNSDECGQVVGATGSNNVCAYIHADLNGAKKPNTYGKDVFNFVIKENGLYPMGCDTGVCPDKYGHACACKVLREGTINY